MADFADPSGPMVMGGHNFLMMMSFYTLYAH